MYELRFSPAAERYFKKLKEKQLKETFRNALLLIQETPSIGKLKTGDLCGVFGYDVSYKG